MDKPSAPHHLDAVRPLDASDAARSEARVADIEIGISSSGDAAYWRSKGLERIRILEEDGPVYGLLPHEEVELATLKRILER